MTQIKTHIFTMLNLFFLLIVFSIYNQSILARMVELILLTGIVFVPYMYCQKKITDNRVLAQMLCLNFFALLVWIAGIVCDVSNKEKKLLIIYGLLCLLFGTACLLYKLIPYIGSSIHIKRYRGLLVLCSIFIALSICTLKEVPIYDSGVYYSWSIEKLAPNFNFTLNNIFDYFFASHISVGYGLLVLIGELMSPFNAMGVHMVNVVLALISVVAFYGILKKFYPYKSEMTICAGTAAYAFTPTVLGLVGMINIDTPCIYLFVILFFCYIKQYDILEFFLAWMFVCTKEPNVIYYCFFVLGIGLISYKRKEKLIGSLVMRIMPMFYWLIYYCAPGRNSWVADISGLVNHGAIHTIGFSVTNLIVKIKELFILNFNWIYVGILLLLIVFQLCIKKVKINDEILPLCTALLGVLLFNLFYLDHPHPRYMVVGTGIVIMLGIIFMESAKPPWLVNLVLSLITILVLVQSFITIDPMTIMSFTPVNRSTANTNLVSASSNGGFNDSTFYNREYTNYIGLLEKTLKELHYNETTMIVLPLYENIPQGYDYDHNFLWDMEDEKIVVVDSEHTIPIIMAVDETSLGGGYERIVYLVPFFAELDQDILTQLEPVEESTITYRNMNLKYYIKHQ